MSSHSLSAVMTTLALVFGQPVIRLNRGHNSCPRSFGQSEILFNLCHRLVGLVVKASASRAEGPGYESRFRRDFSGSSHTSDFKIGTPVATQPGAWHYRVSAGTGRPGVSIL